MKIITRRRIAATNSFAICTCIAMACLAAAVGKTSTGGLTPEERAERREKSRQEFYRLNGGMVRDVRGMKGCVVFVDCHSGVEATAVEEVAAYFRETSKIDVKVCDGAFDMAAPVLPGNVCVFVVNDEKLPPLLVAPESRWAAVNVARLRAGRGEKPQFFAARVKKEISRAFAYITGAADSSYERSPTGPVLSGEDLDRLEDMRLPVDVLSRLPRYLRALGVTQFKMCTYADSVEQGWGDAPTNDVQRAIWDEIQTEKEQGPTVQRPILRRAR